MNKIIKKVKDTISLSYNQFNLDNYKKILEKTFNIKTKLHLIDKNSVITLMSGLNENAGVLYHEKKTTSPKIYIVGKGILFDSGGYDLKKGMNDMKHDKAGMITAFGLSSLYKNVAAYCPVATNFIHNSKITPGDIVSIGRKKVEITSTDAEGRLILASALTTLNGIIKKNDIVITIATLTGACPYAVDTKATAVLGDNELVQRYLTASKEAGEYAWQLPLWDYLEKKYFKTNKIKNWHKEIKADTIGAALFLKQFIKYPNRWIHLDIASSAFDEKGNPNGVPFNSLVKFIERKK